MNPARAMNEAWHLACRPMARRFHQSLDRPDETQGDVLRSILRRNEACAFGLQHGFGGIRDADQFRRDVPLSGPDDLAAAVVRLQAGEKRVLTTDRVQRLIPTSGSTTARKLIPWTAGLRREFGRALAVWIDDLFAANPDWKNGPAYWSVSPALPDEAQAVGAIPVGFDDDTGYLGGLLGSALGQVLAVPSTVRHSRRIENFRFLTLLHLARARDLRLVSVWHPTFFRLLLDALPAHIDRIIQALRTGRIELPCPNDEDDLTASLARSIRACPGRARALAGCDPTRPETLWPELGLISAWGEPDAPEVADLRRAFPSAQFQPKGLLATEGVVSVPVAGKHPLAVTSHFFEFLDDRGRSFLAGELEPDFCYEVVLTTGGGLYRYRLRDRVAVTGFLGATPCLRFAGRAGRVCDLRGEKLDDDFVRNCLDPVLPPGLRFRLLVPDPGTDPPGYILFLVPSSKQPTPDTEALAAHLDEALRTNPHYQLCRFLGQLRPPQVVLLDDGAIEAFFGHQAAHGRKPGEIKPCALDPEPGLAALLAPFREPRAFSFAGARPCARSHLP